MSDRLDLPVLAYDAGGGVRIEACKRRDNPAKWAVRWQGDCLSCDGEWEWDPPCWRSDAWLARHRFATAAEAHAALCRSRGDTPPAPADDDLLSERVAAAGVRQFLDGSELTGPPLPGTLADRVAQALAAERERCAEICSDISASYSRDSSRSSARDPVRASGMIAGAEDCARAIRSAGVHDAGE